MLVVSMETCPSHARIVLISTPARSRWVAVVWRMVCGPTRLWRNAARLAARDPRVASDDVVHSEACHRLRRAPQKHAFALSGRPFTSSFRAAVVDAHSGQNRILFPLPRSCTNDCDLSCGACSRRSPTVS